MYEVISQEIPVKLLVLHEHCRSHLSYFLTLHTRRILHPTPSAGFAFELMFFAVPLLSIPVTVLAMLGAVVCF